VVERKINERSRVTLIDKRKPVTKEGRRSVATYPCPKCKKRMFADEVIDFGTIVVDGERKTGKYHRDCQEGK
jgi:uncharacterized protein YlaI